MAAGEMEFTYRANGDEPGVSERAQIRVRASDMLADRLLEFVKPSLREEIGRRGLFLYSNYTWIVHRRITGGSLVADDALMESEFRKVQSASINQMRLRQIAVIKEAKRPDLDDKRMLAIGLIAEIGHRAAELVYDSKRINPYLLGNTRTGLPVHVAFPTDSTVPKAYRGSAETGLERLIFGHPLRLGENIQAGVSQNSQAYVSDLRLIFRRNASLRFPRQIQKNEVE